eukprot:1238579-Rhodomonas_salina.1
MQPEDLEVVLLWEPEIGGDDLFVAIRGTNSSEVSMDDIGLAICLASQLIESGVFGLGAFDFRLSLLLPLSVVGSSKQALTSCPPGFTGESCMSCQPCQRGAYKTANGTGSCFLCPGGTYSDVTGAKECKPCSVEKPFSPVASVSSGQCLPIADQSQNCGVASEIPFQGIAMAWCLHSPTNAMCISEAGPKPELRSGHTAVSFGESFVVVFGGNSVSYEDTEVHVLVVQYPGLVWKQTPIDGDRPAARHLHSSVGYGDAMIVFGGLAVSSKEVLSDIWSLDLGVWEWKMLGRSLDDMSVAKFEHSAVMVGDVMLVFGGRTSVVQASCSNEVWGFNVTKGVWLQQDGEVGPELCSPQATVSKEGSLMVLDTLSGVLWR